MSKKARYSTYRRKNGSTAYVVNVRHANGRFIRRAFDRLKDADEFYDKVRRERTRVSVGLDPLIEEIKFKDYVDLWLKRRLNEGRPLSSWKADEARIRIYVKPYFGHMIMSKIQTWQVERFLSELIPTYKISPATRNKVRGVLHTAFNDAVKERHALRNPVTETAMLKVDQDKWDVWHSAKELNNYLAAAFQETPYWFYPFVSISVQTGARLGEILALRWDLDVNLEERWICIRSTYEKESKTVVDRTKGGRMRWLGINDSLAKVLKDYRARRPKMLAKSGAYLMRWDDGTMVPPRRVVKVHDRVCEAAGVRRIRFHDLRHQFATMFVKNKGNQKALQKLLGHSTAQMSDRYQHLDPGFLRGLADVVEIKPQGAKVKAGDTEMIQKSSKQKVSKFRKVVKTNR